jgi:hypothetical protein
MGLGGLMHVTGNMLVDENQGLLTLEGLSSLARVDGWLRIWRNMGFESLSGLERLAHVGDKLWVANQPLENLEGLRGLGHVKGVQLVSVSGLTSLHGMRALTRIDGGLFLDEAHQLTNLVGLEYVKELAYNLDIDGAQELRSLEGLGVTRFGEGISVRRTGVTDLTALHAAVEVAGDVNFDANASLAQCEVDALEQKLRGVGWQGMMFSDATGGACDS